ncbi:hypothetical protein BBI17_009914 [Phytophthora kernoviae]|uniref:Uncharacterized protein n=1 Tax=Phytophthora kernoviae TaxID=325452 RepID=A0A421FBI8_9STRA|nr:hypothetical protein BBI17_009914 [Phytophthora kernoviae]
MSCSAKTTNHHVAIEQEFASLEQLLNQTADDASTCLRLLKNELSEYDSRHGNHFTNTAKSYLRSDMRTAKDTASDMKRVAHQINRTHNPSHSEVESARNMMDATAKAMDVLKTTARNYDQKNGKATGVKGTIENVVGKNDTNKDTKGGLLGNKDKDERHGGLFGSGEKDKGEKHGGILGMGNKDKDDKHGGLFGMGDQKQDEKHGGILGMGNKDKDEQHGGIMGMGKDKDGHGNHGGGILGSSDTVESLVKSTLRDNFNLSPLSHQITIAEKSLSSSPSIVDKAKEAIHDVKDKLTGDKTSPTHERHHATHAVNP